MKFPQILERVRLTTPGILIPILLLFTLSCQVRSASAKHAKVRMAVATYTSFVQLPLILAQELGFFADEGVEVTMSDMSGGSKALESLLAGSADVVSSFHDQTLLLAAEGRDLKSFFLMLQTPSVVLVASPRSKIRSIRDLKGGTVAVTAAGSPVHLYVQHLLVENGLSPDDIGVIGTANNAARVAALENGKVSAAIMGEPGLTLLVQRHPDLVVLADLMTVTGIKRNFGTEVYPGTALISSGNWLQVHPDVARGLARAAQRSLKWCREHSPREIADKTPAALRLEDRTAYEQAIARLVKALSSDGIMPREAVEAEKRMLASAGINRASLGTLDVNRTFTNDYINKD